ncbi:hypothetical protein [Spiroplasma endosymbiont of Cleonymus obscurus]|uniref:hypothetical protein n=1 Tax=Spiroplasma endosymbiont of Cleonymus obscurus TaxID=3066324 RepID=UPI0037DCF307
MNKCKHETYKLEDVIDEILYFECLKCKAICSIYARDLDLENEGNVSPWREETKCESCGRLNYD